MASKRGKGKALNEKISIPFAFISLLTSIIFSSFSINSNIAHNIARVDLSSFGAILFLAGLASFFYIRKK